MHANASNVIENVQSAQGTFVIHHTAAQFPPQQLHYTRIIISISSPSRTVFHQQTYLLPAIVIKGFWRR
jgi:hypothetical protein